MPLTPLLTHLNARPPVTNIESTSGSQHSRVPQRVVCATFEELNYIRAARAHRPGVSRPLAIQAHPTGPGTVIGELKSGSSSSVRKHVEPAGPARRGVRARCQTSAE